MASLPEERHSIILDELERHKFVSIAELGQRLNVTRETIRNDISTLAQRNLLQQVRGGAARIEKIEATLSERENINFAGKVMIARRVFELVPDGASLIVDSGSTTQIVARELARKSGLTIFTNDLKVAQLLVDTAEEVHILGGRLGRSEHATRGLDTLEMLANYRADFALIGVGGISGDHGFTDFDRDGAKMRDEMISQSTTALFLAGHEKFGRTAPVKLKNADRADYFVTDQEPDVSIAERLGFLGLETLRSDERHDELD